MTEDPFANEVRAKARRKLAARSKAKDGVWYGLGMMGVVGWSVVVPTLLGAALGVWLDHGWPSERSWTLLLLVAGLVLGCLNAVRWVAQEDRAIQADHEHDHD